MSPETHTTAGIAIAVLSALFTGTGTVVEKIALQRLPDVHARRFWAMIRTLCSSSQWLWGCLLLLGGLVCQGLALSLAPISVAQPIFASGIVLLLVLSHFVLHDHLREVEWFALATIVVALVLLGLSVDTHVDHAGASSAPRLDFLLAAIPTAAVGLIVFVVADRAHSSGAVSSSCGPRCSASPPGCSTASRGSGSSRPRPTSSATACSAPSLTCWSRPSSTCSPSPWRPVSCSSRPACSVARPRSCHR